MVLDIAQWREAAGCTHTQYICTECHQDTDKIQHSRSTERRGISLDDLRCVLRLKIGGEKLDPNQQHGETAVAYIHTYILLSEDAVTGEIHTLHCSGQKHYTVEEEKLHVAQYACFRMKWQTYARLKMVLDIAQWREAGCIHTQYNDDAATNEQTGKGSLKSSSENNNATATSEQTGKGSMKSSENDS